MADPIPWAFEWGGDYSEQLEWLTDVMTAPTGGTQHRRLRESPRTSLAFSTLQAGDRRRKMETLLRQNLAAAWDVPVPVDGLSLLTDAAATDDTIDIALGIARIVVGSRVMLANGDLSQYEICEVAALDADSLTFADGLAADWPAGTQVVPLRAGKLANVPAVERFTSDATTQVQLLFRLDEALDSEAGFAGDEYRDIPVFDLVPVWTTDPVWFPERSLQTLDYGTAVPVVVDLAGVPLGRMVMQYMTETAEDVAAFRSALFALAGRWSPAWVPSWTQDVRMVAATLPAAHYLDIAGPLLSDGSIPANRRDLRIQLVDGSVLYRRIITATDQGGGVERLSLDATFTEGLQLDEVAMISFLVLCVQDADTNLLRHFGPTVVECELTWRELDHEL